MVTAGGREGGGMAWMGAGGGGERGEEMGGGRGGEGALEHGEERRGEQREF